MQRRIKGLSSLFISLFFIYTLLPVQESASTLRNSSSIQEFYRVSAENVVSASPTQSFSPTHHQKKASSNKNSRLVSIIRGLLSAEVKKLENSITDSVMEEVINYYGTKLDAAVSLSNEVVKLNKKYALLNETVQKLDNNYNHIIKSHQNLVNTVRNSISNAKRLREKYLKLKFTTALKRKSLRMSMDDPGAVRGDINQDFSIRKTDATILEPDNLKLQLFKNLETKFSSVVDNNLTDTIVKNFGVKMMSRKKEVTQNDELNEEETDDLDAAELEIAPVVPYG